MKTAKTFLRLLSATLATLLCGGAVAPLTALAADGTAELTVNDSETGAGMFQFDFKGNWVHEGGYPDRFVGGDEHWTTTAQFGTDYPSVTLRFSGTKVALYGHKVADSPFVRITLDGKDMGTVDLYSQSRVEKVLLYESDTLPAGDHVITLEVLADKNPAAGNGHEVSIDYAVVTTDKSAAEGRRLTVNDGELGKGFFQFEFFGKWVHEGGYPNRFEGGDEHWTTTAVFGSDYPGVTFRFVGSRVDLYGHKVSEGAMAKVTIDGKDAGVIDFYHPSRVEKTLLFESGTLPDGEHTLTVQLIPDKNPAAGNTHEAAIDYAVVTTSSDIPATGVEAAADKVTLEAGMTYPLTYKILPEYATEIPAIAFTSSDESVLTVDKNGTITAKAVGKATVTIAPTDGSFQDTVTVTVREPLVGPLTAMAGDSNTHTKQEDYYALFDRVTGKESTDLTATAWLSDTANAKLDLLTAGQALTNVKVTVGDLINTHGDRLDGTVTPYFIKTVLAHDTGKYVPDVLYSTKPFDLPASSVASVWLQIETAADALPGIYTGTVTVTADGMETPETLTLSVEVIALTRPEGDIPFEIWQYPYSSNRYYSGKTTEEYFGNGVEGLWNTHLDPAYEAGLVSQIRLYKKAGGTSVTVTVTEDAWNSQTPDPYPSMVKWTQNKDGSFAFDYTDFDYFVELNEQNGVTGNIMAFSIVDWANRITYYSERSGKVVSENLTVGSERWKKVWTAFLTDFMAHTKEKGWFDRTYMAMDERPADVVEAALDVIESVKDENGQCFKTALAVFTFDTEYLFDRVTDLSLAFAMTPSRLSTITEHRRRLGLTTTLYTCGAQNSALSNPPIESLYTLWYARQRGADGFLRWALDAFNADPLNSSDHRLFAAGDIYMIYPDVKDAKKPTAHSSARFEKLAEGVRDIAKFNWLMENYPDYEKSLTRVLEAVGGDLHTTVTQAQEKVNDVGRKAALTEMIKTAEASEFANHEALVVTVALARDVLEQPAPSDEDLTETAYTIAKLLHALANPAETTPDEPETPDAPVESDPTETENASSDTVPEGDGSAEGTSPSETEAPKKGCRSAVGLGAVTVAVATAAVAMKKKKED
ncbi:MAG: DUF4091 domain-containing protein [Clostridia bacterium]|nr:DUF4091 domain-containing protein [Clostridia bacterium]